MSTSTRLKLIIHEAKTHFSTLLERIAHGEEIIIAKAGHPVARLTGYVSGTAMVREPGSMKGQIHIAEDFNAALPEDLLAASEGRIFWEIGQRVGH